MKEFLKKYGAILELSATPRKVKKAPPEELHLELTYKCNSECIMCNLRYIKSKKTEISLNEIAGCVENSTLLADLKSIVLSGGEPMLRKDFKEILEYFHNRYRKARIHILSNFADKSLVKDNLEYMKKHMDLTRISLGTSLDGLGQLHDEIRGKKGSFDALNNTLEVVRESCPKMDVSLNFTLIPENSRHVLDTYRWAGNKGYRLSFQVVVQKAGTKSFVWKKDDCDAVSRQMDAIIGDICDENGVKSENDLLANKGLLSYLLSLQYIGNYLREGKRYFPNCPCGERYAMIDPYGTLYFCPVLKDMVAGNIRESSFDSLWFSEQAEGIRNAFNEKKCHCWLTCTNGPMLEDALNG